VERRLSGSKRRRGIEGPVGIQPPTELPCRFAAEVGEGFAVLRLAAAGVSDGIAEASPDEMVAKVATDAELVVTDAAGVNGVVASESRCFFRWISQA
jgi:hypothetical protein